MPSATAATVLLAAATCTLALASPAPKPHIIMMLADNVGWANVGFHRPPREDPREVQTPNIDRLHADGLELARHYTYKFCSPSRSAFLSGRLPMHVNIYNDDPSRPFAGVPTNMTTSGFLLTWSSKCTDERSLQVVSVQ